MLSQKRPADGRRRPNRFAREWKVAVVIDIAENRPEPSIRLEPSMDLEQLQATTRGFYPETLGIRFISATKEEIRAELDVLRSLCTLPGRMHGGAIMAFADTLGAYGTVLNLEPGWSTTTIESKTNFFAAGVEGSKVVGICTPLHRGRSTMVWQTRVEREDGKLVALITQTQMLLSPKSDSAG